MKKMTTEVISYKCEWCGDLHMSQLDADKCAYKHAKVNLANSLLSSGYSLGSIDFYCGFNWVLDEDKKNITNDNCFIMSHWECCEKPAYQIVRIDDAGNLKLWGKGGWGGGYGDFIPINRLPKPHPKEDLYVDDRRF